jgi:hypothetical protein
MMEEWKALRNFNNTPSPAELAAFLAQHGDGNKDRAELLASYEHYWANGEHLSDKVWHNRAKVPQLHGNSVG